jgi:NAD(P)-dependent dehydrogenase (short-subunit alcohol dehydrogenase family)
MTVPNDDNRPQPPNPEQRQTPPGATAGMTPEPDHREHSYKGSGRLAGKAAIITGADSGIGRAVAIAFAREGADILISYLQEQDDAQQTQHWVEQAGRRAILMPRDVADETYCRSQMVAERGVRVNCVAPGPIWTPLIPSTMPPDRVKSFGKNTPLGRAGQPAELAPAYVLLASDEGSYMTGALIPVTGGRPML